MKKVFKWIWKIIKVIGGSFLDIIMLPTTARQIVRDDIKDYQLDQDNKLIQQSGIEFITRLNIFELFRIRDALKVLVRYDFLDVKPFLDTIEFVLKNRGRRTNYGKNKKKGVKK